MDYRRLTPPAMQLTTPMGVWLKHGCLKSGTVNICCPFNSELSRGSLFPGNLFLLVNHFAPVIRALRSRSIPQGAMNANNNVTPHISHPRSNRPKGGLGSYSFWRRIIHAPKVLSVKNIPIPTISPRTSPIQVESIFFSAANMHHAHDIPAERHNKNQNCIQPPINYEQTVEFLGRLHLICS